MATTLQQPALPPGPRPLPFVGNVLEFRRDQLGYLQRLQQTYRNMATVYIGKTPIVLLFRPEHVRYILTENPRNFTSREVADQLHQLIGDGLLTIDGEMHREQRRLVQPAFHKKRVESYAQTMVQYTQEMLKEWSAGKRIDVVRAMQELTLRIVAKCLFNLDLADQVNWLGGAFTQMISNPTGLLEGFLNVRIDQPFTAYGKRMDAKRRVDAFIYKLIAQRRADKEDKAINGQKVPPWSYFPFGGGPRICIGMPFAQLEAKLLLATILQRYAPRTAPGYRLELSPLITLRPKHGMPMILIPANADGSTTTWDHLLRTTAVGAKFGEPIDSQPVSQSNGLRPGSVCSKPTDCVLPAVRRAARKTYGQTGWKERLPTNCVLSIDSLSTRLRLYTPCQTNCKECASLRQAARNVSRPAVNTI